MNWASSMEILGESIPNVGSKYCVNWRMDPQARLPNPDENVNPILFAKKKPFTRWRSSPHGGVTDNVAIHSTGPCESVNLGCSVLFAALPISHNRRLTQTFHRH